MKLKTDNAASHVSAIKKTLETMGRDAEIFKEKVAEYAKTIQDDTSKVALEIVNSITIAIEAAKKIIKESGDKAAAGINAIEETEAKARQMRGKI